LSIGFCRDTEGSWSAYFPAHATQVYRVPGAVNDENALLVEPFAVGLHAVLQNPPQRGDTLLIIGAGTIGLCTLAALRALDCEAEVLVLARHSFQVEAARRLGASHVITAGSGDDFYLELARLTGARLLKPMIGKRVPEGGVDATFECTGKDSAVDDALRFTRAGGRVVLVGVPGIAKGIDWTPIFAKELDVRAANTYHHNELFEGKRWRTYDLALHLLEMGKVDLSWLVTHRFRIEEYRQALAMQSRLGANRAIKSVFSYE
jgi:threonine dehydrogenase-like Zn-dependent dehydrogenase